MTRQVLIVDDDATVRVALRDALTTAGFAVTLAEGAKEALALIARSHPDVVVSDVRMPDVGGLELLRLLRERSPDIGIVLLTAFDDMPTVVEAMKQGAVEFLVKPLDLDDLQRTLDRVLEDREARRRLHATTALGADGEIVGRDPHMIDIYKLVGQAAATQATVLIRGESGTGKELVARAIHGHSACAAEPFVPVNCAALPATLLESELFGHVRGAFTGAVANRRGRFALAAKGTIFLDEIGDTSLDFQTKLLRVLQDHTFQPVGSEETEQTNARVIAATHQDLEAMIPEGKFREDLYYRLRVVEISIPPLRDRRGDIPLLAEHMLRRASAALGRPAVALSPEALQRLVQHRWPGNVRELENCLMRAVVVASGGVVRPEHLSMSSPGHRGGTAVLSLVELEKVHVARVLEIAGGHKGRAADLLGVSRPRLNRLIEKYGLK
jgi:two-component system response regulator HydG